MSLLEVALGVALTMQTAPPAPLAPSGKWTVGYEEMSCILSREFGTGPDKVTFAMKIPAIGTGGEFILLVSNDRDGKSEDGSAILKVDTTEIPVRYADVPIDRGTRVVRVWTEQSDWPSIAAARSITLPAGDQKHVAIALTGIRAAVSALEPCKQRLQRTWGLDATAIAAIAKPAESVAMDGWIRTEDYPAEAIRRNLQGMSGILWKIGVAGDVSECRTVKSSGSTVLDDAACQAVTKRGQYTPALNKAGDKIVSWGLREVNWKLPDY